MNSNPSSSTNKRISFQHISRKDSLLRPSCSSTNESIKIRIKNNDGAVASSLSSSSGVAASQTQQPPPAAVATTVNNDDILCVEVSDDDECEHEKELKKDEPQISIQIRQSTDVNPVDKELLKTFNTEFMNAKRTKSSYNSERSCSDHHSSIIMKKPKLSETGDPNRSLYSPNNNAFILEHLSPSTESDNDDQPENGHENDNHHHEDEVIELESLSSHNRNTRIKSSESSSGIRVSSSSRKSTPRRPRLKNSVPADSFERYLTGLTKKYKELTHRERVSLWEFSIDVNDVEDYTKFDERFKKYMKSKRFQNNKKLLMDNNNIEASCSTKLNCKYENNVKQQQQQNKTDMVQMTSMTTKTKAPENAISTATASSTILKNNVPSGEVPLIIPSSDSGSDIEELPKEESILMSINTETKEMYKNDTILIDSGDESHKTSVSINLQWSGGEEDSVFKKNRLNPEIDKISRLIQQSNIFKHTNTGDLIKVADYEINSIENQENFKIPNVPRKYLPNKMDVCPKEEFYKYLGLETKSPNGKCDDDIDQHHEIKRRSLRVRRLQLQHSPNNQNVCSSKDDNVGDEHHMSSEKKEASRVELSPLKDVENKQEHVAHSLIKINETKITPPTTSTDVKPRRSCGPVIKSINSRPNSPSTSKQIQPDHHSTPLDPNRTSESIDDTDSHTSTHTMVQLKRSYKKSFSLSPNEEKPHNVPFLRDLTSRNDRDHHKNGMIKASKRISRSRTKLNSIHTVPKSIQANSIRTAPLRPSDTNINDIVSIMYNKFEGLRNTLKTQLKEMQSSCIELKIDYNFNKQQQQQQQQQQQHKMDEKTDSGIIQKQSEIDNKTSNHEANDNIIQNGLNTNNSTTCSVILEKIDIQEFEENKKIARTPIATKNKLKKIRKNHKIWKKSQKMQILRSSVLNQRILRNRKYVIISAKALSKKSRPRIIRKRKRTNSEKSQNNLLSPARVAKLDKADDDEHVVVKAPPLSLPAQPPPPLVTQPLQELDSPMLDTELENVEKTEDNGNEESGTITKVQYVSPNHLPNPLDDANGAVLHAFYAQDLLIVIQEFIISCWKYSEVIEMIGKSQEWERLGECKRNLNDYEIPAPYKNRLCMNETNPVYLEMRSKQLSCDGARECILASVYVNVYFFDEWKASIKTYSVQLDTIRGLVTDVTYTTITNSRYFIMCWKQKNVLGTNRTGLCKYALTPDLDTLASIREFKQMRHIIHRLECIDDDKLIGFGSTQVTIWDHKTGDVLTNFDLEITLGYNIGAILTSIQFKNYLFLYQTRFTKNSETPELKILAITLSSSSPSFRLIYTHELPSSFANIQSSLCTGNYMITTSSSGEEFLLLRNQPHRLYYFNQTYASNLKRYYSNGSKYFVEISNDALIIKTSDAYLMNFIR